MDRWAVVEVKSQKSSKIEISDLLAVCERQRFSRTRR